MRLMGMVKIVFDDDEMMKVMMDCNCILYIGL